MEEHLTTRQVAHELRVSESSVKRWCNSGAIATVRTVGGHRRIPQQALQHFMEQAGGVDGKLSLLDSASPPLTASGLVDTQAEFTRGLLMGDEAGCRTILSSVYRSTGSIAFIADEIIARSFRELGVGWECGKVEIYQERRACELCNRMLNDLRRLLPDAPPGAPLALGGSSAGDPYTLPSQIVDSVLTECGWHAMNLGCNLPLSTLVAAVQEHQPRLLWLSVSHLESSADFALQYADLQARLPRKLLIVLGGRALTDELRPQLAYTAHCDNMRQLTSLAKALRG